MVSNISLPCLTCVKENNRRTTFSVWNRATSPQWHKLTNNPSVQYVEVHGINLRGPSDISFQLALAVKAHPRVTTISFYRCELQDIGALCLAVTQKDQQLARLGFFNCKLGPHAAETLRLMLEANLLESLTILDGNLDDAALQQTISSGLSRNQSLKALCLSHLKSSVDIRLGLEDVIANNRNLMELTLSLKSSQQWGLFRAAEHLKTLKKLFFESSIVNLPGMEAIVMNCLAINPLQTLSFDTCNCHDDALLFLVRMLSYNDSIIKSLCYINPVCGEPLDVDFGTIKVENLGFKSIFFEENTFSNMLDSLAINQHLKRLDLCRGVYSGDNGGFAETCEVIINQNLGPIELGIEVDDKDVTLLTDAMLENTSLRTLYIDSMDESDCVVFAESLANMRYLRYLVLRSDCLLSEEFFLALLASMEQNISLWTLTFETTRYDDAVAQKYLPRIRYLLAINRVGRQQLLTVSMPVGLVADVLARSSNEPDGMYFLLMERPDFITANRQRKRKRKNKS